jgi:hypothetical protein
MLGKHLLQGLSDIAQEMPAIGDLGGGGGRLTRPVGVGRRAVTRDDLDPRMGLEPLCQGVGGAIREQRHRLPTRQIDEHGPIGLACPQGDIVHAEPRRRRNCWHRVAAQLAEQGVPAHGDVPGVAQPPAGPAPEGQTEGDQALDEP